MAEKKAVSEETVKEDMASKTKVSENTGQVNKGKAENKFYKEQLISSGRFRDRRDLLEALLVPGELYTVKAVEEKIQHYMKGKVK